MMTGIHDFVCSHDADFAAHLPDRACVQQAQTALGVTFGPQLREYLLEYGYLGFESVEFYGLNARQGMESDLGKQTAYLHRYYPETQNLTALENYGEGDYILVDGEDRVFRYSSEENRLTPEGGRLFDYILQRFEEEL